MAAILQLHSAWIEAWQLNLMAPTDSGLQTMMEKGFGFVGVILK